MSCPNINSAEWRALTSKIGFKRAFEEYVKNDERIPDASNYEESLKGVDAVSKTVKALMSDKALNFFKRFYTTNPDKFYTELVANLGATKPQVEQLRALNERTNPSTLSEMAANLLAETTFTVSLEVSGEHYNPEDFLSDSTRAFHHDGFYYMRVDREHEGIEYSRQSVGGEEDLGGDITEKDYNDAYAAKFGTPMKYTSHYSTLTVPGGTNYRENRIVTPAIEPSIKGHAAFAQKNDLGWFRSDEKASPKDESNMVQEESDYGESIRMGFEPSEENYLKTRVKGQGSKTRRILELQSDAFQKSRDITSIESHIQRLKNSGELVVECD